MSIRLMWCGVLIVGAALFGLSCAPTAEAGEETGLQEEEARRAFCGGIAGIPCPEGYTCVDDPSDDCDPERGGADCGGICQKEKKPPACTGREPGLRYVSRDPAQCAVIRFTCEEGFLPFFNDCGCGCQRQEAACDYGDPDRTYVSRDPDQCAAITFDCEEGLQRFFDECGCGCEVAP